jgi:RNA polymerase sigma-70 factor (ECF subfamily)
MDPAHDAELAAKLYSDLRAAAQRQLSGERVGHTLSATALVHEAYLRLAGPRRLTIEERAHFYAAAVEAMRRVLIDHARARHREKRGGERIRLSLDEPLDLGALEGGGDYEELDAAIEALAQHDARMAQVVKLRFLAGFPVGEVAHLLGVSERTVKGDWSFARAWLARHLARDR